MKKIILTLSILFIAVMPLLADDPAPPPPGGGTNGPPIGGGAPIGSGIAILLSLGAAWGGKKVY